MTASRPENARGPRPVLEVRELRKHFVLRRGLLGLAVAKARAVDGVSFGIAAGETLGLVGESGCGKSTVGRAIVRLVQPTSGAILLDGEDIARLGGAALKRFRRRAQMVFQDPHSSLNPRMSAGTLVAEPLVIHGLARGPAIRRRVLELFDQVGLRRELTARYPHEFSGGQRQRLSIARALAVSPALIVADEPVSALDVSVRAQVINLMARLQAEVGLSYLFISHDIGIVGHLSHRVAVMYLGRLMELAPSRGVLAEPLHPYTELLLQSVPLPNPHRRRPRGRAIAGEVPSPINPPPGCRFHPRCPLAVERCRVEEPVLREVRPGHHVSCHLR
jgi:peptide/nickel transport system ATP-binding protein/oligopeptide transport system ATP-binding protein